MLPPSPVQSRFQEAPSPSKVSRPPWGSRRAKGLGCSPMGWSEANALHVEDSSCGPYSLGSSEHPLCPTLTSVPETQGRLRTHQAGRH